MRSFVKVRGHVRVILILCLYFGFIEARAQLNPNFVASSTLVCSGSSVVFTDQSTGTTILTTYSWNFGTGATPATATGSGPITVIYTGSGPSTVSLTLTDITTATTTKTNYITVNAPPVVTFTGTLTPQCVNSTTYALTGGSPAGGAYSGPGVTGTNFNASVAGTGIHTITYTYTDINGCTSSATNTITVYPLPAATLSGTTAVCTGAASSVITFSGSGGTPPYTFVYTLNGGLIQTISTVSGNNVTLPVSTSVPGTFNYLLVSVSDASAANCSQAQTGSAIVTVNPLPSATISGTTTVCKNDPSPLITFTGSSGTPPYTFTYKINGGSNQTITTTTGNSVTLQVSTGTAGTFTYTLVSVQDASSTACAQSQTGSATVTVNPLPAAMISGTTAVCTGAVSPAITFTGSGGTPQYTFVYTLNGGLNQTISTVSGNSVNLPVPTSVAGTYNYSLVSVSDASATNCSQAETGSAIITVNPLPTATINGTATVCKNDPSPLITFTGSSGTPPYTFTYKINGGSNQTITTTAGNSVTLPVPTGSTGTFTYSLVSVQDASSTACSQVQSGSATVTINPQPTATISGSASVCKDAPSPNVTFTGANGIPPYTFTYTINSGSNQVITTTNGNSVSLPVTTGTTGTYTYALAGVSDAGPNSCSNIQGGTATITVNGLPSATISGSTTVCQNSVSPVITFTGSNGTAPYTFTYRINSGASQTVTTASGNSVTVPVPTGTTGTFTYSLQSVQDASSSVCSQAQSGNAVVTINSPPVATIGGTTSVCKNDPSPMITFTGSSGTPPYTFIYKVNGGSNQSISTTSGSTVSVPAPTVSAGTITYSLVSVSDAGPSSCNQLQTGNAIITVNDLPVAAISGTTEVCKGTGSVNITFTGSGGIPPYTFTYKINSGNPINITTTSGNSINVAAPLTTAGVFTYTLVGIRDASTTACSQLQTGSATVTVNEIPAANAGTGGNICGPTFSLNAIPSIGTGTWSKASGPGTVTFNPDSHDPRAMVTVSALGSYTFTWTEVNGSCSGNAAVNVNFVQSAPANAGTGGDICGLSFDLNAVQGTGSGTWTLISGPGKAIFSPDANQPDARVTVDQFGVYVFSWTEVSLICQSAARITVIFREPPRVSAGRDTVVCKGKSIILNGSGTGILKWAPANLVSNPDIANPIVSPSVPTVYKLTATDQYGCRNSDSVNVNVLDIPVAHVSKDMILDYQFSTPITAGDLMPGEDGVWSVIVGGGTFADTTGTSTAVSGLSLGRNVLLWTVNNHVCQPSHALLTITVHDLVIPSLITPNMDGKNDYFVLRGIETLGRTEFTVFDRLGVMVYRNTNYNNDWNGVSSSGNPLPEDTYFYSLKSENGISRSGYIVIRR